jgi:uncharacterized protein YkwD
VKTWIRWSVCALALAFGVGAVRAEDVPAWQAYWLGRFNQERVGAGAPPLRLVPVLGQVAQQQAEEMAREGAWRWQPPLSPEEIGVRLRWVGYSAHLWSEAFAVSTLGLDRQARRTVRDGRFRDVGIGAVQAEGATLYVFLFGWHQGDYFAEATAGLGDRARVAAELLRRVNELRWRKGLAPVVSNPVLDQSSQEHAEDMLARSYAGHWTRNGWGPTERAGALGYRGGVGENIVEQRFSVEEAFQAWKDSPEHLENMLNPRCREMGLGLAIGRGFDAAPGAYRVIWVQSFGCGG